MMAIKPIAWRSALLAALVLPGCKPPPTDAGFARVDLATTVAGPSAPLPSPGTTGAIWAQSSPENGGARRLVYGIPGKPVLVSIACVGPATPAAAITITRHAPADPGAGALLALIGNGMIARIPVDATLAAGQQFWRGALPANNPRWDALKPEREATITVPGAGLVRLNPSVLPMQLITACRAPVAPANRG